MTEGGQMLHGYYRKGEVHHGTEPFTHFVARFRSLEPGDPVSARLLDDVAHHTGNWADGVPDWYDWNEHRLLSWSIGAEIMPIEPPHDYEEPDSIRPAMITLAAYAATGDGRYLGFCTDYADKWAGGLLEKPLPRITWWGSSPEHYDERFREQLKSGMEQRIEFIVAAGLLDYLMDLFHLTGRGLYRRAVERVVPTLVEHVADPRSAIAAGLLAKYRRLTGDTSFDERILAAIGKDTPSGKLVMLETRDESKSRGTQGIIINLRIGHRWDQVRWGRRQADGSVEEITEPSPAAWLLAYQVTGDDSYAATAMASAAERLRLTNGAIRDGRDHGCAGDTVGAVASGHGRADRHGDVNTVFGPIALGSMRLFSAEEPIVVVSGGLPEGVLSHVRFALQPEVTFVNESGAAVEFSYRDASAGAASGKHTVSLGPGETSTHPLRGVVPLPELGLAPVS